MVEVDLVATVVIQFSSTLVGVYLAFWVADRAERRRRTRDAVYAPLAELMGTFVSRLEAWKPLPVAELDHLVRSMTGLGLMPPQFRVKMRPAEASFANYAEHRSSFDTQIEYVASDEIGPLGPAKHALDSILSVTKGDARTVREALFDPRAYEAPEPSREWLSAFLAVAIGTKKTLSPGHKVVAGVAPTGTVVTWNNQEYAMEPLIEAIARRTFTRVRDHSVRPALAAARQASSESAATILRSISEVAKIPVAS